MSVIVNLQDLGTPGIAVTYQCPVLFRKFPQNDHSALWPVVVDSAEICIVKRASKVSHAVIKTFPTGLENVIEGEVIIFFPEDHVCSCMKHPYSKEYPLRLPVPGCFRDAADLLCCKRHR